MFYENLHFLKNLFSGVIGNLHIKKRARNFGSFYLRVGAICFGIGSMVYYGLEFVYFLELYRHSPCGDIFEMIKPVCRLFLYIGQIQFLFLNRRYLDMKSHKASCKFGLMHMLATNICEWLFVLVEETKHDIHHMSTELHLDEHGNKTGNCTNFIAPLIQDSSPFLFPCIIEYSLICAVIIYEMWKDIDSKSVNRDQEIHSSTFDLAGVHRKVMEDNCSRGSIGVFLGVMAIVTTLISVIMYFVLYKVDYNLAKEEVTLLELSLYLIGSALVIVIIVAIRNFKYVKESNSMEVDCKILILAQTGVYLYGFFNILAASLNSKDNLTNRIECLIDEVVGVVQTSLQTLLILSAFKKRCQTYRDDKKPGRESVLFLLVINIAMWIINTFVKGRALFNKSHMEFYGIWAWNTMTHTSMPLAIFYRFHSTVCLYEIWKETYL